ncbi:MAG: Flp pilus assembly complex ATPase component TadA [Betaproteobacteria bacterium]|nr:Flp pilus assembly complex ATPase component TadA [Betaproteobacteria bacterium]
MTNALVLQCSIEMIGELLVAQGLVASAEVERALAFQRQYGGRLGAVLVRMGALSEDALLPVLARQLDMPLLGAEELAAHAQPMRDTVAGAGLARDWLLAQELALWEAADGVLHCVARNPLDSGLREAVAAAFPGHSRVWHLARSQDLEAMLRLLQAEDAAGGTDDIAHLRELAEEAPVVELLNGILSGAADEAASDIHLEPGEQRFVVRYRIDGVLQAHLELPRERMDALVSRVKLISGLDIAERRLPQDGRISVRVSGADLDVRVSVIPCALGESVVMRLLPKERKQLQLAHLGMEADHLAQFARTAAQPHGIILITGPTGSGKSTTLYAALDGLNDRSRKIVTVEDPVEFQMRGVVQIQTHTEIGYDFARALRAILRHDPDIIMIGEMRDGETAEIAVQSALTGHLVLSTLHTNDAASAFNRLLDMGLEPFLVASSVRAVGAQRLVRKLCACATPVPLDAPLEHLAQELHERCARLLAEPARWRAAAGCSECRGTGYRGRLGIYEFINVNEALQQAIMRRASAAEVAQLARADGSRSLREDGLVKAWRGLTSVDEVLRVTGLDNEGGE